MTELKSTASRREAGKAERRRRIAAAAAALLREQGYDAVSMVQIAERAEVSPATLYNLFESKDAIFREVFDLDLADYQQSLAKAPARDTLDRMVAAIDLAADLYRKDPAFYRAMARGGGRASGPLISAIHEPRVAFWQHQFAQAIAEGLLRPEADPELLGVMISHSLRGVYLEWAGGLISADRFGSESSYCLTMMLLAYATEATTPPLRARLSKLQAALTTTPRIRLREAG